MVYIEFVFILNFLLDFMILYGTKRILKTNSKIFRLIISSVIGSLTTFQIFIKLSNIELMLVKISLSLIMTIIAFGKKDILKNTLYFYLISIIFGGVVYLLDIKMNFYLNMLFLIILCPLVIIIFIKEWKDYNLNHKEKYNVIIFYSNKKYELIGFIDTGNYLKDPLTNKSVILVDLQIKTNKFLYVPYKALNTEGIIPCIKPDKLIINNKEIKRCLIGLSNNKLSIPGINCILPNQLKEELCEN